MEKNDWILTDWLKNAAKKLPFNECVYLTKTLFETEILETSKNLPKLAKTCLDSALKKRLKNVPLAKILGKKAFWKDVFLTNEHTLDPRPETEALLEAISIKPRTILELEVGTGCLILSALKMFPKAHGVGIDISEDSLAIARLNSHILQSEKENFDKKNPKKSNNLAKKITFLQNDWAKNLIEKLPKNSNFYSQISSQNEKKIKNLHFDLILANPPYVAAQTPLDSQTLYDPALALFGNEETYVEMFESLKNITFQEFIIEIPENLVEKITSFLEKNPPFEFDSLQAKQIYDSKIFVLKIIKKSAI